MNDNGCFSDITFALYLSVSVLSLSYFTFCCQAWIQYNGYKIIPWYDDAICSGHNHDNSRLAAPNDTIYVYNA